MGETGEGSGGNGGGNWECGTPLSTPSVTEFNLSQTSVRPCHGSCQNSPHKDDFAFIKITNIHQCLITGKFKVQKSTHSLNIGHR